MKHTHKWKSYDGALGYQSMKCEICGVDYNDLKVKPKIDRFKTSVVQLLNGAYSVRLEEKGLNYSSSKPVAIFPTQEQAEKFKTILSKKSISQKEKIIRG